MGSFAFNNVYITSVLQPENKQKSQISDEKTNSILPASQYIMIFFYDVMSKNKRSSYGVIQTSSKRFLFYSFLFITFQLITLVCKINRIAVNSPRVQENFLCLRFRFSLSLAFSTIYVVVLIYSIYMYIYIYIYIYKAKTLIY